MMQRGVREADPQTRKTKFGPTFYVFKIEDVERGPELRGPLTWTAFGSPLCIIRSSNFVFKRPNFGFRQTDRQTDGRTDRRNKNILDLPS